MTSTSWILGRSRLCQSHQMVENPPSVVWDLASTTSREMKNLLSGWRDIPILTLK
jgi:hypothetical protein